MTERAPTDQSPAIRRATCHCGKLSITCRGEPVKVSLCHCFECQRRTGSLFSVAAFFARTQVVETAGEPNSFSRSSASGLPVVFRFCAECGSTVWWEPERMPQLVGVAAGAFADPRFPMPDQAVWSEEAHPWLALPETVQIHPRNPPPRKPG